MNQPTSLNDEKDFSRGCDQQGRELAAAVPAGREDIAWDLIPIRLTNLSHHFAKSAAFTGVAMEMEQGKLHILSGRRGSGKTTLLRLIGLRIPKQRESSGSLLMPAHLRVLHISKEPLFFSGTLYENLTYGVIKGDKDGRIERVALICQGLQIQPNTLALISSNEGAEVARWGDVLSKSDCQLLNLARGLVTNPEVLCVHKPSMGLGPHTVPVLFGMLQAFVQQRGVEMDGERYFFRRPRTCIYTSSGDGDEAFADVVQDPFGCRSSVQSA